MPTVTVFLTDIDHPRAWREVVSDADAIGRIRTSKVVTFEAPWLASDLTALDQIFAICNSVTAGTEQAISERTYRGQQARSLSVGDIVHVPGLGIFAVESCGWKRFDHRLTALAAAHRVAA